MEQNIEDLLSVAGINYSLPEFQDPDGDSQVTNETALFSNYLPLQTFDDNSYDPRTPQEWLSFRVHNIGCIQILIPFED